MKIVRLYFSFAILLFLSIACSTSLLLPTMQDMQYVSSGTDSAQLATVQQGYKLYVNKCGSCHYLYRPHKFSDTKWKAEMPEMAEKAKINEEETKLVLNYLLTISEVELTKATAGQGQKYKKVVQ